mgnify:CR=1 FL=1
MEAERDANRVPTLLGVSTLDGLTPIRVQVNPATGRMLAEVPGGVGDVVGPGASTDNAIVRWNGVAGTSVQNSVVLISDLGAITGVTSLSLSTSLILEETGAGTDTITLQAPAAIAASYILTLPVDDGLANQVLTTDGAGILSWTTNGVGDVVGPGISTDNAVARWNGAGGTSVQNSVVIISDTGAVTGVTSLTISNPTNCMSLTNANDASSSQTATFEGDRATMADDDEAYINFRLSDDAGTQRTVARFVWVITDVNVATGVDGRIDFSVITAGSLNKELSLDGADLSPFTNDGLALGTITLMWSDLFLASGGVINFNNGDVTITHSANLLTIAGGALTVEDALRSNTSLILEETGAGVDTVTIQVPVLAASYVLTLPIDDGGVGQVLTTDGGGVLSWTTNAGGDVSGLGVSTDNAVARWNGVAGTSIQDSVVIIGDTGIVTGVTSLTISTAGNLLTLTNTTDGASVQIGILEGDRATMADNDEAYVTLRLSNDGGAQTEIARLTWVATDVNAGTGVDGRLDFSVMTAGALAKELSLEGTNLSPTTNDGLALGTTALMWSDLFLANGSVVNFNNGDITLTHAANTLIFSGGTFALVNGTTAHGINITQDGVLAINNYGLKLYSNAAQVNSQLMLIHQDNAASTATMAATMNDGSGHGIDIIQVGVLGVGMFAFQVRSDTAQVSAASYLATIIQDNAASTSGAMFIVNDGTGAALQINQNGGVLSSLGALTITNSNFGDCIFLDHNANSASDLVGIRFNINNAGAGLEMAFDFDGSEVVNGAVGGIQDKRVRCFVGGGLIYYIPLYTA